ncbi:MAG: hypothetical protein M0Q90_04120 [Bacteroidales bacterium]|nr:hypothetical protein [Bacteroidales bacterium]
MNNQLSRQNFWIIALNSTAAYMLSYLFLFYLNQFSYLLTAGMYDYAISIDYATYYFHIEPYEWTHDAVILIFSSGYILTFLAGLLSLLAFYQLVADAFPIKVFFFWTSFHAMTFVFGGLMVGNLLTEGIGHVFNWLYLTDTVKLIISLIGFFGLLMMSIFSARLVALSSNAYFEKYSERIGPFFITAQVLVPYLIGSVLIFVYFLPKPQFHERYSWIIIGVMLLLFYLRIRHNDDLMFEEDDKRSFRLMKGFILFTALFYVLSRILMAKGIFIDW